MIFHSLVYDLHLVDLMLLPLQESFVYHLLMELSYYLLELSLALHLGISYSVSLELLLSEYELHYQINRQL